MGESERLRELVKMSTPCNTHASAKLYKPLNKTTNELRLLAIFPSEDINAIVEVQLIQRKLADSKGQFIPFSYVWGDPTDTESIKINGILKIVTKSLASFLRQIRQLLPIILTRYSWDKPARFWADAICIDQDEPEERNHQVQLMSSIYGSAPFVLAYLGHAEDAYLAASMVNVIQKELLEL